eukprot:COSAG06_NODE_847_length_11974_cov_58.239158_14_plen_382_part_00
MAVELAPGLQKLVLVEGGAAAAVAPGASVRLRYAVAALDDSDGDVDQLGLAAEWRSQPAQAFSLVLGRGDALPCVEAAVLSMAPGELARFVLSDSAAGELQQLAPSLAAADTLALTIELVDATTPPRLDLAAATAHKGAGNAAFKAKDYRRAVDAYMRAIDVVDQRRQQASPTDGDGDGGGGGEQQQQQQEEVRAMATLQLDAHNNLSLCSIHTGSFAMALHHCNVVLSTDSTNAKALNRRARAYKGLHDYRSARRDCEGILSLAEERERDGQESATTATGKKAPLCAMPYQKSSFYQDRLGTNVGKTQKEMPFLKATARMAKDATALLSVRSNAAPHHRSVCWDLNSLFCRRLTKFFVWSFPCVCPEPVLVKCSFLNTNG